MKKTAIFVEGQTELIIVREYLLRFFEYQNIDLFCRNLFKNNLLKADYDVPNSDAENHFQIINVGNDAAVLSVILKREKIMRNSGYDKIIGLRDMYSSEYKEACSNREISEAINQKFIEGYQNTINKKASSPERIKMRFAIMETEAWILGLYKFFEKLDPRLTPDFIQKKLTIDLRITDPEVSFFHPANIVESIYELVGKKYDKKKGDINTIASQISKEGYETLLASERCNSFNTFHETIFIPK